MSFQLPETWSMDAMLDYAEGVAAGLLAIDLTEELAKPWDEMLNKLAEAIEARNRDRSTARRSAARLAVQNERWSEALLDLSSRAWQESGKRADHKPYQPMFKRVPARLAARFGVSKALIYSADLLKQARVADHPALRSALDALEACNQTLADAASDWLEARRVARSHEIVRGNLLDELQDLVDQTEIEILKRLPGKDRVMRTILGLEHFVRTAEPGGHHHHPHPELLEDELGH